MKHHQNNYSRKMNLRTAFALILLIAIVVGAAIGIAGFCKGEEYATCWVMCKPGSQVNVRRTPSKRGQEVGYLDACDDFLTDGTDSNGYIRVYGVGDYGEGWVYCAFVVTEQPVPVFEQYVCVSNARVAIRKWPNGPKVERSPWLTNGSNVDVFYIADGWACTSRGYIKAEYLEADPR